MPETNSNRLAVTLPSDKEIVMTRVFDAPRELVFEAMTRPEHVAKWWGPRGTTISVCEIDFRPGGTWRYVLQACGKDVTFTGVFHEIAPPERLVCTECFEEPSLGNPKWQTTLTLDEHEGKTTMTSRVLHASKAARDGHYQSGMERGASETFERLEELLAAQMAGHGEPMEREVEIVRVFDAPRDLVYEAWTKPEHMVEWFGPRVFTNHSCELDVRPGGAWKITMHSPDGADYPVQGVYSEVVKRERLLFTNNAVDRDGKLLLRGFTTVLFEDQGGKTKLTLRTRAIGLVAFAPQMLGGMEQGWSQSLDKLAGQLTR